MGRVGKNSLPAENLTIDVAPGLDRVSSPYQVETIERIARPELDASAADRRREAQQLLDIQHHPGENAMDPVRIQAIMDRLRPFLQADGGDIELLEVTGRKARVRLSGKCAACPSAHLTLHVGVEMAIKEEIPEFEELIVSTRTTQ
jgi:Fe-S cluster biogenesis protein NfuA